VNSDPDPQKNISGSGTPGNVKILLILPDEDLRDFRCNYKWPLKSHQPLKVDILIFVLNI
jgi:hypothetical protein